MASRKRMMSDECRNRGNSHDQRAVPVQRSGSRCSAGSRRPGSPPAPAQGAEPAAGAQGPGQGRGGRGGGRGGGAQYTPAAGAKDLKAVMFNWGWYTGMLRSSEEYDVLMSLEYQGKGTMQVNGQPCNVTRYRTSINYQESGERIQITGTRPNGQSCSTSKSSVERTPGTKTFPVRSSSRAKAKPLRWRQPSRSE